MSTLIFYLQKRKFFFIPGVISILKGNKTITEQFKKYTDHTEKLGFAQIKETFSWMVFSTLSGIYKKY